MAPALVLTTEAAEEAGISGAGPFSFVGFPGVYFLDQPLAIEYLERDEAELRDAMDAEGAPPLSWADVDEGEGRPERENHAESVRELVEDVVDEKAGGKVTTHAEADAVAAELGISFPEGLKVAEKVEAIDLVRAGGSFPPSSADVAAAVEHATEDEHATEGGEG